MLVQMSSLKIPFRALLLAGTTTAVLLLAGCGRGLPAEEPVTNPPASETVVWRAEPSGTLDDFLRIGPPLTDSFEDDLYIEGTGSNGNAIYFGHSSSGWPASANGFHTASR